MVHYGHSNQLRQAKAMGDYLIVGVHTDSKNLYLSPCTLSLTPASASSAETLSWLLYQKYVEVHHSN